MTVKRDSRLKTMTTPIQNEPLNFRLSWISLCMQKFLLIHLLVLETLVLALWKVFENTTCSRWKNFVSSRSPVHITGQTRTWLESSFLIRLTLRKIGRICWASVIPHLVTFSTLLTLQLKQCNHILRKTLTSYRRRIWLLLYLICNLKCLLIMLKVLQQISKLNSIIDIMQSDLVVT